MSTLARDTGSKDPIEQSRSDRELRKARLQPDMSYDFRSRQGDFVASSPAYPGLARGASGGAITGGQPPDEEEDYSYLLLCIWVQAHSPYCVVHLR